MRHLALGFLATLAATTLVPLTAHAEVFNETVIRSTQQNALPANRLLYVNPCFPSGCTVTQSGSNSSINNTSTIPDRPTVQLGAYKHGLPHFMTVMNCVREKLGMFNIQITTENPGSTPHTELMTAGSAGEIRANYQVGGVAPFLGCNGQARNGLAFLFANDTIAQQIQYLCTGIIHEAAHLWGVSHVFEKLDHMSYEDLGAEKWWQNKDDQCHDNNFQPMVCPCGTANGAGPTQNTFRTLQRTFGLAEGLEGIEVSLDNPAEGAWLKPGFAMSASYTMPLDRLEARFYVGDTLAATVGKTGQMITTTPTTIPPGDYAAKVSITDFGDRTAETTRNVHVLGSCAGGEACPANFACLNETCYPAADVTGGLGAACEANGECSTGACRSAGGESVCAAACESGEACPDGYYCRGGAAGVCWPGEAPEEGGGCSTTGSGTGWLAGLAGVLAFGLRRRRRA